ncbi:MULTISPECIES: hypothetical protein [unclassified Micromonospora]|uniref:hypothetical protein n=1 Tax=unclassified Micromonospora TaxID=2617518 RepID=UPI0033295237
MTAIDIVAAMRRPWRVALRLRPRPVSDEKRAQAVEDYRRAVLVLQHDAYRNLQSAMANAAIMVGFLAGWMLLLGEVPRAALAFAGACVVGGALGICYYGVRDRPLGRRLLVASVAFTVLGLGALVLLKWIGGN